MSEKMIFCLGDGKWESKGEGYQKHLGVFNQYVTEKEYSEILSNLSKNEVKISLIHWVEEKDMTDDDKDNYSNYKSLGGCLKFFGYEEAWLTWWTKSSKTQRESITGLKQFDSEIFQKITGIYVKKSEPKEMTVGEISQMLGYEVKIVEESK